MKKNAANSNFYLVAYKNGIIKVYILSRYTLIAKNLTEVVFFEVGGCSIL